MQQRTLAEKVTCAGFGLHSGEPVELALRPARPDTGIVFARRERGRETLIRAHLSCLHDTRNATTLARDGVAISTVEHLLAALSAHGIDNARIDVSAGELPALDGGAAGFVYLLREAGVAEQGEPRRHLRLRRAVELRDGARRIVFEPAPRLEVHCSIDFAHPAIGRQRIHLASLDAKTFERELAAARTFGFLDEVQVLRRAGLARGANLANTLVLDRRRVLNPGGLRWSNEFARHKALDLVGDLALLGLPLRARVRVERGGHGLHIAGLRKLLDSVGDWSIDAR